MALTLRSSPLGYLCALVGVGLTIALRQMLAPFLGDSAPLMAFLLPVGIVAIYCGWGPGMFATLLSPVAGNYFFIEGVGFAFVDQQELTRTLLFMGIGASFTIMADQLLKAKDQANAQAKELRRIDGKKDEFIAMLGHELRNPLSALSTAMEVMKVSRLDAARFEGSSSVMARQLGNINRLLDELLDASRFNLGLVACERELVALHEVVEECVTQCSAFFTAQKVELDFDMPGQSVAVLGDRMRLVQALTNLLINAAKYTPAGGKVTLCVVAEAGGVRLIVEDNGTGIQPEQLKHVFESFIQEPRSLGRAKGGLGLGLSVVKKIVDLHEGTVSASSDGPGQGACFIITLPRASRQSLDEKL